MDQSEVSISFDIKSEADSDRELVPDVESIKGSQGSGKVPLVGPGRGPVDPAKGSMGSIKGPALLEHTKSPPADPTTPVGNPASPIKEESAASERSAVSRTESQGVKPKDQQQNSSVKEFPFKAS